MCLPSCLAQFVEKTILSLLKIRPNSEKYGGGNLGWGLDLEESLPSWDPCTPEKTTMPVCIHVAQKKTAGRLRPPSWTGTHPPLFPWRTQTLLMRRMGAESSSLVLDQGRVTVCLLVHDKPTTAETTASAASVTVSLCLMCFQSVTKTSGADKAKSGQRNGLRQPGGQKRINSNQNTESWISLYCSNC